MQTFELCPPALIYLIFSITQIIIDTIKGLYNTAMMKCIVMVMITFLLNALCQQGLSIISWFIVFIPFILMSVIVTMLLYVFGLDIASGKINYTYQNNPTDQQQKQQQQQQQQQTQNKIVVVPHSPVAVFNPNFNASNYSTNTYQPQTAAEVNNYNNIAPTNQTQIADRGRTRA